jgi:predicted nucleic acid-binding protein
MGLIETLDGRKTSLDANILIYSLEGMTGFDTELRRLAEAVDQGTLETVTSELTLAEVLVKPFRMGRTAEAATYRRYLQHRPQFEVIPVTRQVLVGAARLRASSSLKLPDAIHAATAHLHSCDVFLTNDARIKTLPGLDVVQLADVVSP